MTVPASRRPAHGSAGDPGSTPGVGSTPEPTPGSTPGVGSVRLSEATGRWVLAAAVLGSGVAFLDATVVNVALPRLGEDLSASLSGLQWTVNAYTLTLASLILLGGSLGDRLGRRRVFVVGVGWFAVASLLCGVAPGVGALVAARALQGVGGALLTPGALAMIQASFVPEDRARAVGAWSGLGGIAGAVGPFLGGGLVETVGWRWVFLLNIPVAAAVVLLAVRHVPESRDPTAHGRFDVVGAGSGALGLAGVTYALIEYPDRGPDPAVVAGGVVGVLALVAFVLVERHSRNPMLPVDIFTNRQFTAANLVTLAVYAALGGVFFFLVLALQTVAGFSPIAAGTSLLPVTVLMLLFSARAGALAARIGPRLPMTLGPAVSGAGVLLMARIGPDATYVVDVLPAAVVFGAGLSLTVAPLTATVLSSADTQHAGMASGVNNAVARAAGLLAVAVIPLAVGLSGADYRDPAAFSRGFRAAMVVCAVLLLAGAVLAWVAIRGDVLGGGVATGAGGDAGSATPTDTGVGAPTGGAPDAPTDARTDTSATPPRTPARSARRHHHHCGVGAPPLQESSPRD